MEIHQCSRSVRSCRVLNFGSTHFNAPAVTHRAYIRARDEMVTFHTGYIRTTRQAAHGCEDGTMYVRRQRVDAIIQKTCREVFYVYVGTSPALTRLHHAREVFFLHDSSRSFTLGTHIW